MGRHKKQLTQEQQDWRDSILRGKVRPVAKAEYPHKKILTKEEELQKQFYFINNCVWWINEYIEGRISKERLLETAIAIGENARSLEKAIRNL